MRLDLRKKLHPYTTLLELADALDVTLPHLMRRLRELDARDELTLERLSLSLGAKEPPRRRDDLFQVFHRHQLCLVCGSPMEEVTERQAGWGEFRQCRFCLFSAHENSDFERLREVASGQLDDLDHAFREANRVFQRRTARGRSLRLGEHGPNGLA